ncbi:MAG: lipopolysaccharide heptosyltransferase II [Nitrospinota bacterium]
MENNAEKILIVGPAWIGDMVVAHSLVKLLKARRPEAVIGVLAPPWPEPLLARMSEVHEAIRMPLGHGQLALGLRWRLGRELRARHYEHAIILPNSFKSAFVPFAAGVRRRTGFLGELRWGLLNDIRALDEKALPRVVDRFNTLGLEPGEPLPSETPQPRLQVHPENAAAVLRRLNREAPKDPVLGLCPGAEYGPAKRWPVEYFAEVANAKLGEGWQVWLFGSEKDSSLTGAIQALTDGRCLDLGGRTRLAESIDLMGLTTTVVTNDSGLMSVAAALGKRVIAIYGSTDPGLYPPLSQKATSLRLDLECSPCAKRECPFGHYRCLRDLKPELVLDALEA